MAVDILKRENPFPVPTQKWTFPVFRGSVYARTEKSSQHKTGAACSFAVSVLQKHWRAQAPLPTPRPRTEVRGHRVKSRHFVTTTTCCTCYTCNHMHFVFMDCTGQVIDNCTRYDLPPFEKSRWNECWKLVYSDDVSIFFLWQYIKLPNIVCHKNVLEVRLQRNKKNSKTN